jgi:oligopeptidase B
MPKSTPPIAARRQHAATVHQVTREDPYHWLRAPNWQEVMQKPEALDAEIRDYLEAENAFFEAEFGSRTADLQETIYKEIRGRIKEDDSGIASPDGPFAYNSRMLEGQQYPLIVRTPRDGGSETILLDCNAEAGNEYFGFAGAEHDRSHQFLAWAADRAGSEYYDIVVRNIETGTDRSSRIPPAPISGTRTPARFTTPNTTTTTAPTGCACIPSAQTRRMTPSSSKSPIQASLWASAAL